MTNEVFPCTINVNTLTKRKEDLMEKDGLSLTFAKLYARV
jgi:hypothetical protein